MGYVIRIVGPAGRVTYLHRGNEVEDPQDATYYPHPSSTEKPIASFKKSRAGQSFIIGSVSWKLMQDGEA